MDGGAWWATVHGVTMSWIQLSDSHTHTHTHTHTYCVSNLKDSETINGMGGQKDLEESLLLFDNILEVFLRQEVDGPP